MDALHDAVKNGAPLHHAIACEGDQDELIEAVFHFLESALGETRHGNPDILLIESTNLSVDESRTLAERAGSRGTRGRRFFIIGFENATIEAQNALLKLLEEPPQGAHFFLIVPNFDLLLPTVRSRLHTVRHRASAAQKNADAETFLSGTLPERLKIIEPIIKDTRDDAAKRAALRRARGLGRGILHTLRDEARSGKIDYATLASTAHAVEYLEDRAPSPKMLLEYLAVTAPRPRSEANKKPRAPMV